MKKVVAFMATLLVLAGLLAGCGSPGKEPANEAEAVGLTVSAAISLKDAVEELAAIYTDENPAISITFNFASSGTLQKQIEEGAPVDLFISAGMNQMDALAEKGLIVKDSRRDILGNELVLIAGQESTLTGFSGLTDGSVARVCIANPETAPVGKYAREALTTFGLWDELQPRLVLAKDVRQVLTYVETGNVDAGLVYRSDAMAGQGIKIVAVASEDSHGPIVYPMAIIKTTKHRKETEAFAAFLASDEAAKIFAEHGFKPLGR